MPSLPNSWPSPESCNQTSTGTGCAPCSGSGGSGATGTAGCTGDNVACITTVDGFVTSITDRPIDDVPLDALVQDGATEGQVIGWNGTAWVPVDQTGTGGGGGVTFQAIATNFATGITLGFAFPTFNEFSIDGDTTKAPPFVLYSTPTECSFTYFQQETNLSNDCDIGFQISATSDFSVVLVEEYIALGELLGLRTDTFDLTGLLSGGPPYYVRWGYRNPTTLPTINITNMSITFDGGGGGGSTPVFSSFWMLNQDDGLYYEVSMEGPGAQLSIDQTGQVSGGSNVFVSFWMLNQDDGLYYEVTMVGPGAQFSIDQSGQPSPP